MIQSKYGHQVERFTDMRPMFERKDIDVIGNAELLARSEYHLGLSGWQTCLCGEAAADSRLRGL